MFTSIQKPVRWVGRNYLFAERNCSVAYEIPLYRYEGDVAPYDKTAGWIIANPCESPCSESLENGHFILRWDEHGDRVNYHLWIARPEDPPPPETLWVEWRFRSNNSLPLTDSTCDGKFTVDFDEIHDLIFMFADASVSFSGNDFVLGLDPSDFHLYRFESLNGSMYNFFVDGTHLASGMGNQLRISDFLQMGGTGGCNLDIPVRVNEWDFVRYGTISFGEQIVSTDPPNGFLDAREHVGLDRFTITYDSPNYAYIDDTTVESTGVVSLQVIATRRLDNGEPDTVEIVLDQPIPLNATTRFTFNDGIAVNVIEYIFAPSDTDGDGMVTLSDFAAFQRCFDQIEPNRECLVVDMDGNNDVDLLDYREFQSLLQGP